MEGVLNALQKPVSGDLAQNGHHKSLGPRKLLQVDAWCLFLKGNSGGSSHVQIWWDAGLIPKGIRSG